MSTIWTYLGIAAGILVGLNVLLVVFLAVAARRSEEDWSPPDIREEG